jgi:polysaccharide biosynthesis protein PelG
MAGISLPLRRLLGSRSILAQTAGYAVAGLSMAGPWLLTALHMQVLGRLHFPGISWPELQAFQSIVLYSYCGSMLLTGLLQLVAARHLSDRLFVQDQDAVAPAYTAAALLSLILHGAAAGVAIALLRPPPLLAMAEIALFGAVGLVSTGMIFLGVLRSFSLILAAFVAGIAAALAASQALAPSLGLAGLVFGFAAGHGLIAGVFLSRLRAEFPSRRPWDFGLIRTALRHPALPLIGVATAAAIWIDKMIFWSGPWSLRSDAGLRICPLVDNGFFLASFTILPSLVILFVRLEGSFHDKYAGFFGALRSGADLPTIRRSRAAVVSSFDATVVRIAVVQGMATLGAILLAPHLLQAFRQDWISFYVFRAACLGAYLQMLALAILLSAIHLALYRIALAVALVNVLTGAVAAWATREAGPEYLGVGSVAAGGISLLAGYPWIRSVLKNLERHTFMSQVGSGS